MQRTILCLLVMTPGCASLPAAPVEQSAPAVGSLPPPIKDHGQVVIDAVDAPAARLNEVVGRVKVPYGVWGQFSSTEVVTKERCSVLPCVIDVPRGESDLEVLDGTARERFRVTVAPEQRIFVRARLPEHHVPALGVLGWTLVGVSAVPLIAGTTMLAADPNTLGAPAAVTLIGGVVLAVVGVVLGVTNPITSRPGTVISW
jgi:hypothetical protein